MLLSFKSIDARTDRYQKSDYLYEASIASLLSLGGSLGQGYFWTGLGPQAWDHSAIALFGNSAALPIIRKEIKFEFLQYAMRQQTKCIS